MGLDANHYTCGQQRPRLDGDNDIGLYEISLVVNEIYEYICANLISDLLLHYRCLVFLFV